jgi:hypothetical protein
MTLMFRNSHHYQRDQIRDDRGALGTQGTKINSYVVFMGKPEEKKPHKRPVEDGR